jgi:hypothetical protein
MIDNKTMILIASDFSIGSAPNDPRFYTLAARMPLWIYAARCLMNIAQHEYFAFQCG